MPGILASNCAAAFSAVLRATYNLRSSSSPVAPPTKTCSITGSVSRAILPTTVLSTGTTRHPSTTRPSLTMLFSNNSLPFAACFLSWGRNTMPTPEEPSANPAIAFSSHHFPSIFHGIVHMIPAPSPESSSALHAPRCSMHPSAMSESVIVLCVLKPFKEATNPTPHASRSSKICSRSTAPPV